MQIHNYEIVHTPWNFNLHSKLFYLSVLIPGFIVSEMAYTTGCIYASDLVPMRLQNYITETNVTN